MLRRLVPLVTVVALGVSLEAAGEGWIIERLDFRLDIQRNTSIEVTEALDVDFRGLARHGIFRDIVTLLTWDARTNRRYEIALKGVTDAHGKRHQVKTTTEGSTRRFRIGDPDRTISGKQTYRLAYRLDGALNSFPDHDELYWNATGTWPVAVEHAVIHVTAPANAIERAACFQGRAGSTEPCDVRLDPDETVFTATRPLADGEQMTIVAGLRKGAVASPTPLLAPRPRSGADYFDVTPTLLALTLAGFVAALAGVGTLWWKIGRDRHYISMHYLTQDEREERVPLFASDPIVVEFEPPEKIRPAQMGLLFDERADTLDVTATIVDLAVRGYLKITELPRTGLLAWLGKSDYQLDRLKPPDGDLLRYERIVLDGLFGSDTSRKLSELRNSFYTDLAKAQKALYADAVERGWFPQNPESVRNAWRATAIMLLVASIGVMVFLGSRWGAAILGFPVFVAGLLVRAVSSAMPRRTARGREAMRRALGFARYIKTAEQRQQEFAERAGIFTAYLPYAIAMKCVDRWARAFQDLDLQQATRNWYAGTSQFDAGSFSSNLSGFSSSLSSAIASTPGGSGGSGFGGGSSGGGGGGGGGGSW